jgi:hypothetical protein
MADQAQKDRFVAASTELGGSAGNGRLRVQWDEAAYNAVKDELVAEGVVTPGRGRGGSVSLKVIAHELLVSLKGSVSVDWSHRESARARMRVLVKRILRKHGYPPDLQDAAVQTVLRQAEALSAQWAVNACQPMLHIRLMSK